MTLRISSLTLALAALALQTPAQAFPHGQRNTIVYAYPQTQGYAQQPYAQQPSAYLMRRHVVVTQPQHRPRPIYRPLPAVQTGYAPHPGFPPQLVNRHGDPVTDYPVPVYPSRPAPILAGGNGLVQQPRTCRPVVPLVGAALGGTVGAVMAHNSRSRNRIWALPMGAAVGGILGGVASGC
ncbi:MAG: hypothetical protein KFB97_01435 [Cyanobium sp. M30B3]|nr:MAG: hypothetical protein KFB97_01435 [Cyanobium sp. M30B3]